MYVHCLSWDVRILLAFLHIDGDTWFLKFPKPKTHTTFMHYLALPSARKIISWIRETDLIIQVPSPFVNASRCRLTNFSSLDIIYTFVAYLARRPTKGGIAVTSRTFVGERRVHEQKPSSLSLSKRDVGKKLVLHLIVSHSYFRTTGASRTWRGREVEERYLKNGGRSKFRTHSNLVFTDILWRILCS